MPSGFNNIKNLRHRKFHLGVPHETVDSVAVEEPLEIVIAHSEKTGRKKTALAVTMRTPGNDLELVAGFLLTEGIITSTTDLLTAKHLAENTVLAELAPTVKFDPELNQRNFFISSSCGVCGKASLDAVHLQCPYPLSPGQLRISPALLTSLPDVLRQHQDAFQRTGGLHAAALFSEQGALLFLQEDVGRHNALDKVIGQAIRAGAALPLHSMILLVSGRAGFELVQKAVMAGIPVMAAVGAPTSLSVELAEAQGLTLAGFLRGDVFNVYSGFQRISL